VSEKTGAGFIEYIAAVAGFLLGYGVGLAIASAWAVLTDSFLERSAEAGAPICGILLQYGLGLLAALIAFRLAKALVTSECALCCVRKAVANRNRYCGELDRL
jgi:hypothetical protein